MRNQITKTATILKILAIDPGLHCGYAYYNGFDTFYGVWNLKGGRFEGAGFRFIRFVSYLNQLPETPEIVYYEEVRGHKGTDAAHMYGAIVGHLQAWCEEGKIPYSGIPVGTIKKFATGKGNSGKPEMIAAAHRYFSEIKTSDEADAVLILQYVLEKELPHLKPSKK